MKYSLEKERDSLFKKIEELTGLSFINQNNPPEKQDGFTEEVNELINKLENIYQRIHNRNDVHQLSQMMKELKNFGELSPEMKKWWINRY